MFVFIAVMTALFIMDSILKEKEIQRLQASVVYLSDKYESLQKQSDKQQRQINQDFLILTEGWKD